MQHNSFTLTKASKCASYGFFPVEYCRLVRHAVWSSNRHLALSFLSIVFFFFLFFFFSFFSTSSLSVNNCACLGFFTFKLLILADVASSSAPSRGEKCIEFTQNGQLRLAKLSSFSWRNVSTAAGLLETGDFGRRNCAPEGF